MSKYQIEYRIHSKQHTVSKTFYSRCAFETLDAAKDIISDITIVTQKSMQDENPAGYISITTALSIVTISIADISLIEMFVLNDVGGVVPTDLWLPIK